MSGLSPGGFLRWTPFLALLLCSSCLRVQWSHSLVNRRVSGEEHASFIPGSTDMERCLDHLGAPLYVWEESIDRTALAWGWSEARGWGVNLSVPVAQQLSATMDFETESKKLHGIVMVFDAQYQLVKKRVGILADLTQGMKRRRPSEP